jgi:hypothetical protein
MKPTKWKSLLLVLALLLTQPGFAQDALRGVLTMGLGDVAATKQKAEAGDSNAQVAFGDALASKFRSAEALQWYRKAANQGNVQAAYLVGNLLLFGASGIPNDQIVKPIPTEGIRWTFQAATNLHANAFWNMSKAMQRGLGVSTNLTEAYAWLQLFAETVPGSIVGRVELNNMAIKLDSPAIQQAQRLAAQFKTGNWQRPVTRAIPEGATSLKLNGIAGGKTPLAIINGKTFAEGESGTIPFKPVPLTVKCLKIDKDAVTIVVDGEDAPRVLRLK